MVRLINGRVYIRQPFKMSRRLTFTTRRYATHKPFVIARGSKSQADQIIVSISDNAYTGIGACVPYPRYDESIESVSDAIQTITPDIDNGLDINALQNLMPPGAARNAVDCALWDLHCKISGQPIWKLAGLNEPVPRETAVTLSVGSPNDVAAEAKKLTKFPLLKLKLAGDDIDQDRITAAFSNAPSSQFILDANEGLDINSLNTLLHSINIEQIALIEQPVAVGEDETLSDCPYKALLCADESFHTQTDIEKLAPYYGAINIKLDKAGGFTQALESAKTAHNQGLTVMLGCMLGSSLAMAPAFMLSEFARYIDLDGPLLLAQDDDHGFTFEGSVMHPASIWGTGR